MSIESSITKLCSNSLFPPSPNEIRHIVSYSGGLGSWAAAKRVAAVVPVGQVTLLFADVIIEDQDTYRFVIEGAANIFGVECPVDLVQRALALPELSLDDMHCTQRKALLADLRRDAMAAIPGLVWIADGRHPWQVCEHARFIANSQSGLCSKHLKGLMLDQWQDGNVSSQPSVLHIGIDWTEKHRLEKTRSIKPKYNIEAPLCEKPYLAKQQMIDWCKAEGVLAPRAYRYGFPHNNCGGFCVKAGQAHFAHLLRTYPNRYQWHEAWENRLRSQVGDYSILKDRRGGVQKPLTLTQLRGRIEAGECFASEEWGGCGCALPDAKLGGEA